jgi:hypothetical protein
LTALADQLRQAGDAVPDNTAIEALDATGLQDYFIVSKLLDFFDPAFRNIPLRYERPERGRDVAG